jgi:site-specific recombinase XerD
MAKVMRLHKAAPKRTWSSALEEYLLFKKAQGLRDITVKGHRNVMELFFKRHPSCWPDEVKEAVYRFMGEDIKPGTFNIRRNYMRQFFAWAVGEGYLEEDPMVGLKKRKDHGRMECLDEDQVRRLLLLPDRTTFAGLRDYALLCFVLDTGARPKEAFSLRMANFNLRSTEVMITSEVSKTGVSRTLPLSPVTVRTVKMLIGVRHELWSDDVPVFCSAEGTPLRNDTWGDRLEKYGDELGVKLYPYMVRHTFATLFLRAGGNALALQRLMGHSTLEMTRRYVHLNQGDMRTQHAEASPMQRIAGKGARMRRL